MALARLSGSEGGPTVGPETFGWRSRGSEADPPTFSSADHHPAATAAARVGAPTAAATAGPAATAPRPMGGAKRSAATREAGVKSDAKRPRTLL